MYLVGNVVNVNELEKYCSSKGIQLIQGTHGIIAKLPDGRMLRPSHLTMERFLEDIKIILGELPRPKYCIQA